MFRNSLFYCPRCHKPFKKTSSVNRHLSQRNSACARSGPEPLVQVGLENPIEESLDGSASSDSGIEDGATNGGYVPNANGYDSQSNDSELLDETELDMDSGDRSYAEYEREPIKDFFAGAGTHFGRGQTFIDRFNLDVFSELREENIYYPFAARREWEVGSLLLRLGLSMAAINEFLSLEIIQNAGLSFSTAKELRARAELLPAGPQWLCKPMTVQNPTKAPVHLYYRDPTLCLQALMQNPLVADHMEFAPYRLYRDAEKSIRVYMEWLSGQTAWQMQEKLPVGATLLGTILSSDKTQISIMTGNRTAYPLLISLANIKKEFRLKNSHNTFMLLALLPVAKFIHNNKRIRGLLHDQLTHACLDLILLPLKVAALQGIMLSDPFGFQRLCYPILASYTADTPEAQLVACVGQKSSPVTTAMYKQFGDTFRHDTRTSTKTLAQLQIVKSKVTSAIDYLAIYREASKLRLNGVLEPFWQDWIMADPSIFLTPEPLHHWHKGFWDHDAKWCIAILGPGLIDFLFTLLQPRVGYRQFRDGISSLKQVTGRDHREIQRYIIPIIACIAPRDVVFAIRSLMDVRYLAQCSSHTEATCRQILASLNNFHQYKDSIIHAGGRLGKKGVPIDHFRITKLELYHSIVPSILANGSTEQWNADITEHTHHTDIKVPARAGNNQSYDAQILRTLDRMDKCRQFDLATSMIDSGVSLRAWVVHNEDDEDDFPEDGFIVDTAESLASHITPVSTKIFGTHRSLVNYFEASERLLQGRNVYQTTPPKPFRIFSYQSTAFQLARDPQLKKLSISAASDEFSLLDLFHALNDFVLHLHSNGDSPCRIGGRRGAITSSLSFEDIQVWNRLRIQTRSIFYPHDILPAETVNCFQRNTTSSGCQWPHGLFDTVLVNTNADCKWPQSKMTGHSVAQLRMIFRIIPPNGSTNFIDGLGGFLAYVQRFDLMDSNGLPDPVSGMYSLRRSLRADGSRQGGIIQLKHIRRPLTLVPKFRHYIDHRLRKETCMEYYSEFWLNDYFDKETFYSFRLQ